MKLRNQNLYDISHRFLSRWVSSGQIHRRFIAGVYHGDREPIEMNRTPKEE